MRVLWDSLQSSTFRWAVVEVVLVGAIGGVVGVHVLLRRLPFFVVAMSHAMFPGVAVASVLGLSLFLGGTAFGLVVVAAVVTIGASRVLDQSSAIGVVLAGAFALGVLVLTAQPGSSRDLSAFLVGSIVTVTPGDVAATALGAGLVVVVLGALHKELVASAFDRAGSAALGYPVRRLDTLVLAAVTVTMATTIPATGTLLSVALLTVPALTARLWTDRVGTMMALAAGIGAASGLLGLAASAVWRIAAGGAIGLAAAALFTVSLAATAGGAGARTTAGVGGRVRVRRAA
jgi:ABC-type Mn2+/Zn2+ transport system permease subunit